MSVARRGAILAVLLALVLLAGASSMAAQTETYALGWWTVDGGGGVLSGGAYTLISTVGQHDAGVLSAGRFVLQGGFWAGGLLDEPGFAIYLPLVTRG